MNINDRAMMRAALAAIAPMRVAFHGAPSNAPKIPKSIVGPCGYIALRVWGRDYVTIHPAAPLTPAQADAVADELNKWRDNAGESWEGNPDTGGWPFAPRD